MEILEGRTLRFSSYKIANSKTVRSLSFAKKILSEGNSSNICVLSQCIVYWIHFQNIQTFTYQKTLFQALFCLFLESPKAFSLFLRGGIHGRYSVRNCVPRNFLSRLRPATLLKRRLAQMFSCDFCENFWKNLFYRTPPGDCFWMPYFENYFNESCEYKTHFNPLVSDAPFLYPLKTSKTLRFADVFRG